MNDEELREKFIFLGTCLSDILGKLERMVPKVDLIDDLVENVEAIDYKLIQMDMTIIQLLEGKDLSLDDYQRYSEKKQREEHYKPDKPMNEEDEERCYR